MVESSTDSTFSFIFTIFCTLIFGYLFNKRSDIYSWYLSTLQIYKQNKVFQLVCQLYAEDAEFLTLILQFLYRIERSEDTVLKKHWNKLENLKHKTTMFKDYADGLVEEYRQKNAKYVLSNILNVTEEWNNLSLTEETIVAEIDVNEDLRSLMFTGVSKKWFDLPFDLKQKVINFYETTSSNLQSLNGILSEIPNMEKTISIVLKSMEIKKSLSISFAVIPRTIAMEDIKTLWKTGEFSFKPKKLHFMEYGSCVAKTYGIYDPIIFVKNAIDMLTFNSAPCQKALNNAYKYFQVAKSASDATIAAIFNRKAMQLNSSAGDESDTQFFKLQAYMAIIFGARNRRNDIARIASHFD